MKLNKAGILQLADDLVANRKKYNQNVIGVVDECGTFCCMIGLCHIRVVGIRKFNRLIKTEQLNENDCVTSGLNQLGLPFKYCSKDIEFPQIFQDASRWPRDLQNEYYYSDDKNSKIRTGLMALQRLRPDGKIERDPKKVHTLLPQLKAILKTVKK